MGTVPCFSAISRLSPHRLGQAGHHPQFGGGLDAGNRPGNRRKQAGKETETAQEATGAL
jgi:hypothetical protein